MIFFRKKFGRILITILFVSLSLSASFSFGIKPAKAQIFVPVGDVLNTSTHISNGVSNIAEKLKDYVGDSAAWFAAKMAAQMITADIVDWINGGGKGSPRFISDIGGFFLALGDQVAGNFIYNDPDLNFLCSPFSLGLPSLDLRLRLSFGYFGGFRQYIGCRLTDVFNNVQNAAKFANGDFYSGGWDGWITLTQVPQNNQFGQFNIAFDEMHSRVAGEKAINKQILSINKGFKAVTDKLNQVTSDVVTMPGDVISGTLTSALGTGQRSLEAADELNEIISASVGTIAQAALMKGLSSLTQSGSFSAGVSYRAALQSNSTPLYGSNFNGTSYQDPNQNQAVQDNYNQAMQDAQAKAQAMLTSMLGCEVSAEDPRISLYGASASQPCTRPNGNSALYGSPGYAIDGSLSTAAFQNDCTLTKQPAWWRVKLTIPEYIEQIHFETLGVKDNGDYAGFQSWPLSSPVSAPRALVFNSNTPTTDSIVCLADGSLLNPVNGNCSLPQTPTKVDNGTVNVPNANIILADTVELDAFGYPSGGIGIKEVNLNRHPKPVLGACKVPTILDQTQGTNIDLWNGPTPSIPWVTAAYFTTYPNIQKVSPNCTITGNSSQGCIQISVTDSAGNTTPVSNQNGTYVYSFPAPGNYTVNYAVSDPNIPAIHSSVNKTITITPPVTGGTSGTTQTGDGTPPFWNGSPTLIASAQAGSSIHLTWQPAQDNGGDQVSYYLYRSLNGVTSTINGGQLITGISFDDNELMPNTTYTYSIEAVDQSGLKSDKLPVGGVRATTLP